MFSILRHESLPNVTSHYYYPAEKVVISKKTGFAEIFFSCLVIILVDLNT